MDLPAEFVARIVRLYGVEGQSWIDGLPQTIAGLASEWGLTSIQVCDELTYGWIAYAVQGERDVVLKLGPIRCEIAREAKALAAFQASSCVRRLNWSECRGALLLERLNPGTSLEEPWRPETDRRSTEIIADSMRIRPVVAPSHADFPSTRVWADAITPFLDIPWLRRAWRLARKLEDRTGPRCLLHGDLHHGNVLADGNGWTMIDPKGVVGHPAFEVYALLHNPVRASAEDVCRLLPERIQIVREVTGMDTIELAAYGFVGLAISAAWDMEDGEPNSPKTEAVADGLWKRYIQP